MRLAVATCIAGLAVAILSAEAARLPRNALRVPLIAQTTNWSCGPAALSSVLHYWGAFRGPERSLRPRLGTNARFGTRPEKMVEVARAYGLQAHLRQRLDLGDLRRALARGETLILNLQAWPDRPRALPWQETWNAGHYAVLVGMDGEHAYFMDPWVKDAYATISLGDLAARWHDRSLDPARPRRYLRAAIAIKGSGPLRRPRLVPME